MLSSSTGMFLFVQLITWIPVEQQPRHSKIRYIGQHSIPFDVLDNTKSHTSALVVEGMVSKHVVK
jgi:hypothetical protein